LDKLNNKVCGYWLSFQDRLRSAKMNERLELLVMDYKAGRYTRRQLLTKDK
jgi:hypothetical protein